MRIRTQNDVDLSDYLYLANEAKHRGDRIGEQEWLASADQVRARIRLARLERTEAEFAPTRPAA